MLTDEASNVTVQLRGGNAKAGRYLQITGSMVPNATAASGATQLINVTNVKDLGACTAGGVPVAGAGGGASASIGTVAIVAIVVVGAGLVSLAGYAAAGGFTPSVTP
jgi:hypothetical protein